MHCPKCEAPIQSKDINVSDDIVLCRACGNKFRPSECLELSRQEKFKLGSPPNGSWIKNSPKHIEVGSSTRSAIGIMLLPLMLIFGWLLAKAIIFTDYDRVEIGGIITIIILLTVYLCFLYLTLLKIFGKATIKMNKIGGEVFVGFWGIGIHRKFKWKNISSISEEDATIGFRREKGQTIVFKGRRRLSLGIRIAETNRKYMVKAIQQHMKSA